MEKGREKGREEGLATGYLGQIQLCQSLLGRPDPFDRTADLVAARLALIGWPTGS